MGSRISAKCEMLIKLVVVLLAVSSKVQAQLNPNFYAQSCPNLENIARNAFTNRVNFFNILALPANILRLAFHDCAVDGCEGSVLLDGTSDGSITDEKASGRNVGIGNLPVIFYMKQQIDAQCQAPDGSPVVSCADVVALAGREAYNFAKLQGNFGSTVIPIGLGRRDGVSAQTTHADAQLLPADTTVNTLLATFRPMGLNDEQIVSLLGSHTIGVAHCVNIQNRLYPSLDLTLSLPQNFLFAQRLQLQCPLGILNSNTVINNDNTNTIFDNQYFQNAMGGQGLLTIDNNLRNDPRTSGFVSNFANNQQHFFDVFAQAYSILTSNNVLTGTQGEIRRDCTKVNS